MNKLSLPVAILALVLAAYAAFFMPKAPQALGAQWRNPNSDFSAKSISSNSACLGIIATSTATPGKIVVATAGATSTFNGTAYFQFGTCP